MQARVQRISVASLESICPSLDQRGKHLSHLKISDAIKKQIDEHIRSFSVMKSHYSRSHHNKRRKYLSPLLSVADMHELYLQNRSMRLLGQTSSLMVTT